MERCIGRLIPVDRNGSNLKLSRLPPVVLGPPLKMPSPVGGGGGRPVVLNPGEGGESVSMMQVAVLYCVKIVMMV